MGGQEGRTLLQDTRSTIGKKKETRKIEQVKVSHNPLVKMLARLRMCWADWRGHHGKVWDYEPGEYYMGRHQGHRKHEKRHGIK